MPITASL